MTDKYLADIDTKKLQKILEMKEPQTPIGIYAISKPKIIRSAMH